MAARKAKDWAADARRYAGKNSAPNVGPKVDSVHGVNVNRPYVKPPKGRSFDDQGWQTSKKGGH